jgi:predicted phage tail protein
MGEVLNGEHAGAEARRLLGIAVRARHPWACAVVMRPATVRVLLAYPSLVATKQTLGRVLPYPAHQTGPFRA